MQAHLKRNDCRNRGYILDGFPRTFKDAQNCFLTPEKKFDPETGEEIPFEEEEVEEGQEKTWKGYVVDGSIFPAKCIVLQGSDDYLMTRVRDLPESAVQGTHYTAADMARRLKAYRTANNSQVAEPSVQEFFGRNGVQVFNQDIRNDNAMDAFKIYIEKVRKQHLNVTGGEAIQLHDV